MATPPLTPEAIAILERLGQQSYALPQEPRRSFGPLGFAGDMLGRITSLRQLDAANAARLGLQRAETAALTGEPESPPSRLGGPPPTPPAPGTPPPPTRTGSSLHPRYVDTLVAFESSGNPNAVTGSFRGLGQFGRDQETRYGITDWTNPDQQRRAIAQHGQYLAGVLRTRLGRDPTPGEVYLGHQQGEGGAPALLTANPNETAFDVLMRLPYYQQRGGARVVRQAIENNLPPNLRGRWQTIGANEFANFWVSRFNSRIGVQAPVVPTGGAPQAVSPTQRRVTTFPVGPGGQASIDGIMRLGRPEESEATTVAPTGPRLPSGPELAPEQELFGAPGSGLFIGAPGAGRGVTVTATASAPTTRSITGAPVAATATAQFSTGQQGEAVRPPQGVVDVIEQSIPGNPERIRQIERLRRVPMSEARRDTLNQEYTKLTEPTSVNIPNLGTARYVYDRQSGRYVLDSFQGSASVQTTSASGVTVHGLYAYSRDRGWTVIPLSRSTTPPAPGTSAPVVSVAPGTTAPGTSAPTIDATELNAAIASGDISRILAAKADFDRQVAALQGQSTARSTDITEYERTGRTARERLDDIISLHTAVENTHDWRGYGSQFLRDLRTTMQNWGLDPGQLGGASTTLSDFATRLEGALPRDGSGPQFSRFLAENPHLNNTKAGALLFLSYMRQRLNVASEIGRAVTRLGANTHRLDETIRDIRSRNPITLRHTGSIDVVAGNGTRRVNNPTIYITPIETQADFDRLPPGAVYIGAGGRYFQKPLQ